LFGHVAGDELREVLTQKINRLGAPNALLGL
jgi:hypothetical protein